jgi:hypothetical protein
MSVMLALPCAASRRASLYFTQSTRTFYVRSTDNVSILKLNPFAACGMLAAMDDYIKDDTAAAFWGAVVAELRARRAGMLDGPHSVAALARRIGVSRARLANRMLEPTPLRVRGDWPSVEAVARAFKPRPAPAFDVAAFGVTQ